jgi:hypothetical protein
MMANLQPTQEKGVTRSMGKRISFLAGVMMAGVALVATAGPSVAQAVPTGAQASALVGSGIAVNCPPGSPGATTGGTATVNGVTVGFPAGAACTPTDATSSGEYSFTTSSTGLRFNAACSNTAGTVTTNGFVDVPAGTTVAGLGVVAAPTPITTLNTAVTYPNGRTAVLNVVTTTPTAVTRDAIVFAGGPTVGHVVCGTAAYPLAVDAASSSGAAPALAATPLTSTAAHSGPSTGVLVLGGFFALAVVAQIAFGRKLWRRGDKAIG